MRHLIAGLFLLFSSILYAQTVENEKTTEAATINWDSAINNTTVVSLNTTSLLIQLIPFNRSNPTLVGPYSVSFARYKEKNRAFTVAMGFNLGDQADRENNIFLNLKVGWEKRKAFYQNWYYTKAWDIFLSGGGGFNTPGGDIDDTFIIGTGPTWGIGYNFNPIVGIHLETSLLLGLDFNFGTPDFRFIPPVALYFHVAVPRKKKRKRS